MATVADRKADAWVAAGGPDEGRINSTIDAANSGNTEGFTARDWAIVRANPGYTTPSAAASQDGEDTDTGGGGGGDTQPAYDPDAYAKQMWDLQEQRRITNAIEVVRGILTEYGLESLYNKMVDYIKQGYEPDAITVLIRTTPEYKQRFPAMEALAKRGRALSEAEYIEYERRAAQLEQMYGLPANMIQDNVTTLLTEEVSADELQDRVVLAAAASVTAPEELKTTLRNFYGIDQGGLAGYFLDPNIATPILEKQYATGVIGSEALRQDVSIGRDIATNLQELGVTREQAREGFGQVRRFQPFTQGRGDVVSQERLIGGTFGQEDAAQEIERVQRARQGRFQEGGSFVSTQGGVGGVGTSAT